MSTYVVLGAGVTGRAIARAVVAHGHEVRLIEDMPNEEHRAFALSLGISLIEAPSRDELVGILTGCAAVLPSPGIPERHPIFAVAVDVGVGIQSEFDLARQWDDRPLALITGTNGKTTVTMMVTAMLEASGLRAAAVGNTETPLVEALPDQHIDVFVVEASSFRLGHTERISPAAATWLNFAPDHLDVHDSLASYERAKASIWANLADEARAIAVIDDAVVARHAPPGATTVGTGGAYAVDNDTLVGPEGPILAVAELSRRLPHDVTNALAAVATARACGASMDAIRTTLRTFVGLPHRMEYVATIDHVDYFNDSKATAPHAVHAALSGFTDAVLIAGGQNKGLDLSELARSSTHVSAVIAIGAAAAEVEAAFSGLVPVTKAESMSEAVLVASRLATVAVVLSPGCASFDWYDNYGARGDDFRSEVMRLQMQEQKRGVKK